jgi:hypothetical protein
MAIFGPIVLMLFVIMLMVIHVITMMPMLVTIVVFVIVAVPGSLLSPALLFPVFAGYQIHSALGAAARLVLNYFRVHGAGIFGRGLFVSMALLLPIAVILSVPVVLVMLMIVAMMVFMLLVLLMFVVVLMLVIMAVFVLMSVVLVFMSVVVFRSRLPGFAGYQIHAAFGATAWLVLDNFRVHGANILNSGMQDR